MTLRLSRPRRKPNISAGEDSPPGPRGGRGGSPGEERIAGQAPGSSERTEKNGRFAARAEIPNRRSRRAGRAVPLQTELVREGIPKTGAEIGEVRAAGVVPVDQVGATKDIYGEVGTREERHSDTRARFGEVRPILPAYIRGEVRVPIDVERPIDEADTGLAVGEGI